MFKFGWRRYRAIRRWTSGPLARRTPSPLVGRAIAYDTTFRFVIPAERRQAREPGPKNSCLGLISDAGILGSRIGSLRSPAGMTTRKAAKKSYAIALPERGRAAKRRGGVGRLEGFAVRLALDR